MRGVMVTDPTRYGTIAFKPEYSNYKPNIKFREPEHSEISKALMLEKKYSGALRSSLANKSEDLKQLEQTVKSLRNKLISSKKELMLHKNRIDDFSHELSRMKAVEVIKTIKTDYQLAIMQ